MHRSGMMGKGSLEAFSDAGDASRERGGTVVQPAPPVLALPAGVATRK